MLLILAATVAHRISPRCSLGGADIIAIAIIALSLPIPFQVSSSIAVPCVVAVLTMATLCALLTGVLRPRTVPIPYVTCIAAGLAIVSILYTVGDLGYGVCGVLALLLPSLLGAGITTLDPKSGVAYGFVAVIAFIGLLGGIVYVLLAPALNGITLAGDHMIARGQLSTQTASTINWSLAIWHFIPLIGLFGILLWAIIRALEDR